MGREEDEYLVNIDRGVDLDSATAVKDAVIADHVAGHANGVME